MLRINDLQLLKAMVQSPNLGVGMCFCTGGEKNSLTHVLTHTGIGNNGDSSTKWIYDLRDLRKSGLKSAK